MKKRYEMMSLKMGVDLNCDESTVVKCELVESMQGKMEMESNQQNEMEIESNQTTPMKFCDSTQEKILADSRKLGEWNTHNSHLLELSEAQTKLEELHRDVQAKDLLLQQTNTAKSNAEAELVLSQAREQDLQIKLSELLARMDEFKAMYSTEKEKGELLEQQCEELTKSLHQSQ